MTLKHTMKHMEGYMPVVEAADEGCLLGGRKIDSGPVFERFFDALYVMNSWIEQDIACHRSVKVGKVVEFKGTVSCMEP